MMHDPRSLPNHGRQTALWNEPPGWRMPLTVALGWCDSVSMVVIWASPRLVGPVAKTGGERVSQRASTVSPPASTWKPIPQLCDVDRWKRAGRGDCDGSSSFHCPG